MTQIRMTTKEFREWVADQARPEGGSVPPQPTEPPPVATKEPPAHRQSRRLAWARWALLLVLGFGLGQCGTADTLDDINDRLERIEEVLTDLEGARQ